jgi:hypothetical protein
VAAAAPVSAWLVVVVVARRRVTKFRLSVS